MNVIKENQEDVEQQTTEKTEETPETKIQEQTVPLATFLEMKKSFNTLKKQIEDTETKQKESQGKFEQLYQEEKMKREAAEKSAAAVNVFLNKAIERVPEEMRDIIPNIAPEAKLEWITNAESKGLFKTQGDVLQIKKVASSMPKLGENEIAVEHKGKTYYDQSVYDAKNYAFYRANKADIQKAEYEGRIIKQT